MANTIEHKGYIRQYKVFIPKTNAIFGKLDNDR